MFAPCDDEGYVITFAVHEDYTDFLKLFEVKTRFWNNNWLIKTIP